MSEYLDNPDELEAKLNWEWSYEVAHRTLDKIDFKATGRTLNIGMDKMVEPMGVTLDDGQIAPVVRERHSSREARDKRQDVYYYLGKQATGQDALFVLHDLNLDHETELFDRGEGTRIIENHWSHAERLTQGLSDELVYPEVTEATDEDMRDFLRAIHGLVAAQRELQHRAA